MKRLSESLEDLATRVGVLEQSATAAFEADRAKLQKRHQEIEATVDSRVDELDSAIQNAAEAGRTWWKDTKASIVRPFDELRARHEKRQSEHELRRALRDAEDAEEDAAAAIDLATYFLNVAELAVVDAALARLAADDLAGAFTGGGFSAPTAGATS